MLQESQETQETQETHSSFGPRFTSWLNQRIPPSDQVVLNQRNVFIFPSKTGFAFAGLIALLIVGAINYQSSLVFAVAFLLGALFLVTILHTFQNLSGLQLELASTKPGFVGEAVEFSVRVVRGSRRSRNGIELGWRGGIKQWADLEEASSAVVHLYETGAQRGWMDPGRLLIETYFPLGLLRAWTWVDLNARALVYPKPIESEFPDVSSGNREEGALIDPLGSDDFTGIKPYQAGDPVRHMVWRSYAKSDNLTVKQYSSYLEPRLWLDLESLSGNLEDRIGKLTALALQAHRLGREFGMRLGSIEIKPQLGEAHLNQVLRELALFGHSDV